MWEISNTLQVTGFIYSVLLGAVFALVYDVFKSLRNAVKHSNAAIFIEDMIFSVICAFVCFCFLLAVTDGGLRLFVFFGAAIGFIIFRASVSRFTLAAFSFLFSAAVKAARVVSAAAAKFNACVNVLIIKIYGVTQKIIKKCVISRKNA